MSKAIELTGGPDASETAHFAMMFDHFFDTLNVSDFISGRRARKTFQQPFHSSGDFRLKVHCNTTDGF